MLGQVYLKSCILFHMEKPVNNHKNSMVQLEIKAGNKVLGKLIISLYTNWAPQTTANFRALCTGEKGFSFKGSSFNKIIPGFMCQGGEDIIHPDGAGGKPLYDESYKDDYLELEHYLPALLSTPISGTNTIGSQFIITTRPAPELDGKNIVFGTIASGHNVLKAIMQYGSSSGETSQKIIITDCGMRFK